MSLTGKGLVAYVESKLGANYVYGSKMEKLTQARVNSLAKSYPSIFDDAYIAKANKLVGTMCTDCSGLIQGYTKKSNSSASLYSSASKRIGISEDMPVGTVVWKSGHVGVYIGKGYVIEARGINYGVVKAKLSATKWKYGLLFDYMPCEEVISKPIQSIVSNTAEVYRVRRIWRDSSSQIGAYTMLENAIRLANENKLNVYNSKGEQVYSAIQQVTSFKVKVSINDLKVRAGAGTEFEIRTAVNKNDVFTIIETSGVWGRLKSGAGWINTSAAYVTVI